MTVAAPTEGGISLGSRAIADVIFHGVDGTDHDVQVRCKLLRLASVVCGPASVEVVTPDPGSPAP